MIFLFHLQKNSRCVAKKLTTSRSHTEKTTLQKIQNFNWELLPHPLYSSDIAPNDYYLFLVFPHLKKKKNE